MLWARGQLARSAKNSGIEARALEHAKELLAGAAQAFGWTAEVEAAAGGRGRRCRRREARIRPRPVAGTLVAPDLTSSS
jgi:hypothetical protein